MEYRINAGRALVQQAQKAMRHLAGVDGSIHCTAQGEKMKVLKGQ